MAEAKVTGIWIKGQEPVTLIWNDGEIGGDPAAAYYLEAVMEQNPTVLMTPTGPWFKAADSKQDGWAFIATARTILADASYSQHGLPSYAEPINDPSVVS